MLLSCHINLVKLEKLWLFKILGMTYNLERREYIIVHGNGPINSKGRFKIICYSKTVWRCFCSGAEAIFFGLGFLGSTSCSKYTWNSGKLWTCYYDKSNIFCTCSWEFSVVRCHIWSPFVYPWWISSCQRQLLPTGSV